MASGDFKDLSKTIATNKVLRDEAFNITKIRNMMDVNAKFLQWLINLLIKNTFC